MSKKAQTILIFGIIGTILWVLLFFFSAHVSIVKILDSKLILFQAWSAAWERMRTATFQVFPIPKRVLFSSSDIYHIS